MAAEDQEQDQAPAGPQGKGKGKHHPGHGLLTGPHRDEILVASSVVLVVLAYLTLRRSSGGAAAGSMTVGAGAPGMVTAPSGTGQLAGYDASMSDAMAGFQTMLQNQADQLQTINGQLTRNPAAGTPAPAPTPAKPAPAPAHVTPKAMSLFGPAFTGHYLRYYDGTIAEVESDGSLLHLNRSEWAQVKAKLGKRGSVDTLGTHTLPTMYTVQQNINRANPAPAPKKK